MHVGRFCLIVTAGEIAERSAAEGHLTGGESAGAVYSGLRGNVSDIHEEMLNWLACTRLVLGIAVLASFAASHQSMILLCGFSQRLPFSHRYQKQIPKMRSDTQAQLQKLMPR